MSSSSSEWRESTIKEQIAQIQCEIDELYEKQSRLFEKKAQIEEEYSRYVASHVLINGLLYVVYVVPDNRSIYCSYVWDYFSTREKALLKMPKTPTLINGHTWRYELRVETVKDGRDLTNIDPQ